MNFDRNLTSQTSLTKNNASKDRGLVSKVQKLPIVKRVYLYILLMAAIGTVMGETKYRLESKNCMANDLVLMQSLLGETPKTALHRCWTVEPAQRRIRELSIGAVVGVITATLIGIPALLEED